MSETLTFRETAPPKRLARAGAGRKKDPNPYLGLVKRIIGQTREIGGETLPLTVAVPFTLDVANGETLKQHRDHVRRKLTRSAVEIAVEHGVAPYAIELAIRDIESGEIVSIPRDGGRTTGAFEAVFWHKQSS